MGNPMRGGKNAQRRLTELASSIASKCLITYHIKSAIFTYSNIAKVYFDSVEELPDGEGAMKNLPGAELRSIKWGSTYAMLVRYIGLYDNIRNCNFDNDALRSMPTAVDHARAVELCSYLSDFNVVSKLLQMDGQKAVDLDDIRVQFDVLSRHCTLSLS